MPPPPRVLRVDGVGRPRPMRRRDWIEARRPRPRDPAPLRRRDWIVTAVQAVLVLAALQAGSRQRCSAGSRRAPGPHAAPGLWGLLGTPRRGRRAGAPAASGLLGPCAPAVGVLFGEFRT